MEGGDEDEACGRWRSSREDGDEVRAMGMAAVAIWGVCVFGVEAAVLGEL